MAPSKGSNGGFHRRRNEEFKDCGVRVMAKSFALLFAAQRKLARLTFGSWTCHGP